MLISNPDLINSCRVCRSPNQDGDYECLYQTKNHEEQFQLTEAGKLYENLLDIPLNFMDFYPQFLCNSCDLQMKLFKKLKDKAVKTWEYLQMLYEEELQKTKEEVINEALQATEEYHNINEHYDQVEEINEIQQTEEQEQDLLPKDEIELGEETQSEKFLAYAVEENFENLPLTLNENETQLENYQEYAIDEIFETDQQQEKFINTEEQQQEEHFDGQHQQVLISYNQEENFISLPIINANEVAQITTYENTYTEAPTEETTLEDNNITSNEASIINYENSYTEATTEKTAIEDNNITSSNTYTKARTEEVTLEHNNITSSNDYFEITSQGSVVIDKSDYITEIYELMEDDSKTEQYSVTTEHLQEDNDCIDSRAESSIAYSDIEYVESVNTESNDEEIIEINPPKKRKERSTNKTATKVTYRKRDYTCGPCKQEFKTLQEFTTHRSVAHDRMFPCNICSKILMSRSALCGHKRRHNNTPAFECDLCHKTFNQKVHYQYHMNKHNNIRNFKCENCKKTFISKADVRIHMRTHTGERPYVCDICGKDYLMMEHLKAHKLSHTVYKFQCDQCKQTFATHKTLRTHMTTIHTDEPKFKCEICVKPFRRKHHLEYHYKLHHKGVNLRDTHFELLDDFDMSKDEEYAMDVFEDDEEYVDDPGYEVLHDDAILM